MSDGMRKAIANCVLVDFVQALKEGREYFIIKRGLYYRPDNCGYTDRPILAGLYTKEDAINTSHPNGPDGPRDGMFCKHHSEVGDSDWLAFKVLVDANQNQAARIAELEEKLDKLALMAETANHGTDEHRLMPAAGVADIVYEAIEALSGEQT